VPIGVGPPRRLTVKDGDRVVISVEGNVLTFNGKAPQTAEITRIKLREDTRIIPHRGNKPKACVDQRWK
jgi:hypothetical protein